MSQCAVKAARRPSFASKPSASSNDSGVAPLRLPEPLESRVLMSTTHWINPAGGNFDTSANWSNGVPTAGMAALIEITVSAPVTKSAKTTDTFASLFTIEPLVLSGGTLDITGKATFGSKFTIKAGTLKNATISTIGSGSITAASGSVLSGGTLDAVTLASPLTVPIGNYLGIAGGLTFDSGGRITLQAGNGGTCLLAILPAPSGQTIGGTGQILFEGGATGTSEYAQIQVDTVLTIGKNVLINGGGGVFEMGSLGGIINKGAILADFSDTPIAFWSYGAVVDNQGVIGAEPGDIQIESFDAKYGHYTLKPDTGALVVGIGGPKPGDTSSGKPGYGVISSPQAMPLGGQFIVTLLDGFKPTPGEKFDVLTYASHIGSFKSMNLTYPGTMFEATINSTNITLTDFAPPVVTLQPESQTVPSGSKAAFTAEASGWPTPTILWQVSTDNGAHFTDIPGAKSTFLLVTATAGTTIPYEYRAVFTNSLGKVVTNVARLFVHKIIVPPA